MNDEEIKLEIGKRLKECRIEKGYTQSELAEACPCSVQHISYIENGKRGMSRELAYRLSQILLVEENYLLLESDFKTNDEKYEYNQKLVTDTDLCAINFLAYIGYRISFLPHIKQLSDGTNELFDEKPENSSDEMYQFESYIETMQKELDSVEMEINGTTKTSMGRIVDLIEDLTEYAHFLMQGIIAPRKNKRLKHISVEHSELSDKISVYNNKH